MYIIHVSMTQASQSYRNYTGFLFVLFVKGWSSSSCV